MYRNLNVWFQLTILFLYSLHCYTEHQCADFEYPDLKSSTVTRTENSSLVLSFRLNETQWCLDTWDTFDIVVVKKNIGSEQTYCSISHLNGECSVKSYGGTLCSCPEGGIYTFTKTANRVDSGEWIWRAFGGTIKKSLIFNIEYDARITDLNVIGTSHEDKVNDKDSEVEIVCFWDKGNPSVTALLFDRHGMELNASDFTRQIRYTFPAVSCEDAGLIRCEAPRASKNETATLLVRCPPEITPIDSASDDYLNFTVRSHTRNLTECRLLKMPISSNSLTRACSLEGLTGTPPDLTLSIRLDQVSEKKEGLWRLELTNDAGTGNLNIHLSDEGSGPPEITFNDSASDDYLSFSVRSHTRNLTECRLLKMPVSSNTLTRACSLESLSGTPPDLSLTILLENVRKEMHGLWRLGLTNDAGTGYTDIHLGDFTADSQKLTEEPNDFKFNGTISEEQRRTSTRTTGVQHFSEVSTEDFPAVYIVTETTHVPGAPVTFVYGVDFMVVTSVAILAVTFIVVRIIRAIKGTTSGHNEHPNEGAQPMHPVEEVRQDDDIEDNSSPSIQEANYYWEVRDDSPASSPELPRPCVWPALPEDYLHPTVSPGVEEGTDDATKATPLYENSVLRNMDTPPEDDTGSADRHEL